MYIKVSVLIFFLSSTLKVHFGHLPPPWFVANKNAVLSVFSSFITLVRERANIAAHFMSLRVFLDFDILGCCCGHQMISARWPLKMIK